MKTAEMLLRKQIMEKKATKEVMKKDHDLVTEICHTHLSVMV
jgi:hypothetical protein